MAGARTSNILFVEGTNDQFVVLHLLRRLRPDLPAKPLTWCGGFQIKVSNSDTGALSDFKSALKSETGRYGLILDADITPGKGIADRWQKIREVLAEYGVPEAELARLPPTGWIGTVGTVGRLRDSAPPAKHPPRAGVWIMPDNRGHGEGMAASRGS